MVLPARVSLDTSVPLESRRGPGNKSSRPEESFFSAEEGVTIAKAKDARMVEETIFFIVLKPRVIRDS
tara:strand:+ start:49 stop:252 length:204 start_codon:yes stop_codon:yes gene_type:complete